MPDRRCIVCGGPVNRGSTSTSGDTRRCLPCRVLASMDSDCPCPPSPLLDRLDEETIIIESRPLPKRAAQATDAAERRREFARRYDERYPGKRQEDAKRRRLGLPHISVAEWLQKERR